MWKLFFVLSFLSTKAWSFNLTSDFKNGFYWSEFPISMTVVDGDPIRKENLEVITKKSMNEWESETGLSIWNFVTSGSSAATSNIIRWSTNFAAETGMDANSVLAVAIRYTNGPYFAKTEIVINGGHYLNRDMDHLYTTITHELGHTMGLDHSSVNKAVMAPVLQNPYYGLDEDDTQGMDQAFNETQSRQVSGYISPLAFQESKSTSASGVGCGMIQVSGSNNMVSLSVGLILGFLKKIFSWLKSFF